MKCKLIILVLILTIIVGCSDNIVDEIQEHDTDNIIEVNIDHESLAHEYADIFYNGDIEKLYEKFSDKMKKTYDMNNIIKLRDDISDRYGDMVNIAEEHINKNNEPYIEYIALLDHEKSERQLFMQIIMDDQGIIESFLIRETPKEAQSRYLDYKTKTALELPFKGEWFVLWGGRSVKENYHAAYKNQRFAYDFAAIQNDKLFRTDGKTNDDYYAYGQKIYAPGNGKIIEMANNVTDNTPGKTNPNNLPGNYVVIDHLNGEYSFMAHFKTGSVKVKVGDMVSIGQEIGLCGNSGNSSMPHLHYHLQDSRIFRTGEGLPAFFKDYYVDDNYIDLGEPVKSQIIGVAIN